MECWGTFVQIFWVQSKTFVQKFRECRGQAFWANQDFCTNILGAKKSLCSNLRIEARLFKNFGWKATLFFFGFCSNMLGAKQHFCSNILGAKQHFRSNVLGAKLDFSLRKNIFLSRFFVAFCSSVLFCPNWDKNTLFGFLASIVHSNNWQELPSAMRVQGGLDVREAEIFGIHVLMLRPHCTWQNREFGLLPQQKQSSYRYLRFG